MQMVNHQAEFQNDDFHFRGKHAEYCKIDDVVQRAVKDIVSMYCSLIYVHVFSLNKCSSLHVICGLGFLCLESVCYSARRVGQISDHGQIYIIVSTLSAKKRNIFSGFYLFCVLPGSVIG